MTTAEINAVMLRLGFRRRHTETCRGKKKIGEWDSLPNRAVCACPYYSCGVHSDSEGFKRRATGKFTLDRAKAVTRVRLERGDWQADSRLAQDIGMDGDDAVEFFQKFETTFHVDLSSLWAHWHQHFVPEGGVASLGCVVAIGVAVVVGGLLHEVVRWVPVWAGMIVSVGLLGWIYFKFFNDGEDNQIPVTVQELVDAANSGKWPKEYEEQPAAPLFRTFE